MNEVPVVVVMGQRTGPSTGLPTYTGQTDLHFMLHAGQGEFPRLVIAPGDAEQAVFWSGQALSLSWRCQVPAVILVDKTICEGTFSLIEEEVPDETVTVDIPTPRRVESYRRYAVTDTGISPLLVPPSPGAVIKANSYVHDERGITTEKADMAIRMTEKRLRKAATLKREADALPSVGVFGEKTDTALVCWGSTLPVCRELAEKERLRVVQPIILSPFPEEAVRSALEGARQVIMVEENALGQLQMLCASHGISIDKSVRRYDGRPFSIDELELRVGEVS
jgi:2-oxoglutarate ferredoxin oxidoreductase subunit alpha